MEVHVCESLLVLCCSYLQEVFTVCIVLLVFLSYSVNKANIATEISAHCTMMHTERENLC